MRKLTLLFSGLLLCTSLTVMSQEKTEDPDQVVMPASSGIDTVAVRNDVKPKRLTTGLDVGTSFSYSRYNFFGPSYYIAPHLTYQLTPRFLLSSGVTLERSTFYPLYEHSSADKGILPMTRTFLYARGSYLVNDRLTVSGTVYKTINDVPRLTKYSAPMKYNYQGASLDLQYKVTKSISFGVHVRTQSGYNNGYYYPGSYLMSPGGF